MPASNSTTSLNFCLLASPLVLQTGHIRFSSCSRTLWPETMCGFPPLITDVKPYLNHRPSPLLPAPSLSGVSLPEKIWDLWQTPRLSECPWPPLLISSPNRVAICLFSASLSWKPSLILSHIRHLNLCRPSASSGEVSYLSLSPQLYSGQLGETPGSEPHSKSWYQIWITESFFSGDKFGSNWSTQADC